MVNAITVLAEGGLKFVPEILVMGGEGGGGSIDGLAATLMKYLGGAGASASPGAGLAPPPRPAGPAPVAKSPTAAALHPAAVMPTPQMDTPPAMPLAGPEKSASPAPPRPPAPKPPARA